MKNNEKKINEMENEEMKNQINIELTEEIAQGIYSNLAIISHSASEFIVDFVRLLPGLPKAKVQSRIILTPDHAKRLMAALQDNIVKYEMVNGKIKMAEDNSRFMNMNFGPTAQA